MAITVVTDRWMKFYFHLVSLGTVHGMVGLHQYTVPGWITNAPANNEFE